MLTAVWIASPPVVSTIRWSDGSFSSTLAGVVRLVRFHLRLDLPKLLPLVPDPLVVASFQAMAARVTNATAFAAATTISAATVGAAAMMFGLSIPSWASSGPDVESFCIP